MTDYSQCKSLRKWEIVTEQSPTGNPPFQVLFLLSVICFLQTLLWLSFKSYRSQFKCRVLRESLPNHLTTLEYHHSAHSQPENQPTYHTHIHTVLDLLLCFTVFMVLLEKSFFFFLVWVYVYFFFFNINPIRVGISQVSCMAISSASRIVCGS